MYIFSTDTVQKTSSFLNSCKKKCRGSISRFAPHTPPPSPLKLKPPRKQTHIVSSITHIFAYPCQSFSQFSTETLSFSLPLFLVFILPPPLLKNRIPVSGITGGVSKNYLSPVKKYQTNTRTDKEWHDPFPCSNYYYFYR